MGLPHFVRNDLGSGCYVEGQERKGWGHPPKVSKNTQLVSATAEMGKIKGAEDFTLHPFDGCSYALEAR